MQNRFNLHLCCMPCMFASVLVRIENMELCNYSVAPIFINSNHIEKKIPFPKIQLKVYKNTFKAYFLNFDI